MIDSDNEEAYHDALEDVVDIRCPQLEVTLAGPAANANTQTDETKGSDGTTQTNWTEHPTFLSLTIQQGVARLQEALATFARRFRDVRSCSEAAHELGRVKNLVRNFQTMHRRQISLYCTTTVQLGYRNQVAAALRNDCNEVSGPILSLLDKLEGRNRELYHCRNSLVGSFEQQIRELENFAPGNLQLALFIQPPNFLV